MGENPPNPNQFIAYMIEVNNANGNASNAADGESVIDSTLSDAEKVVALEEQNKKLFERAKKGEGFVKDSAGNWIKKTSTDAKPSDNLPTGNTNSNDKMYTREEFDLRMDGYSDKEVDFISKNGGRKSLEDSSSFVSVAIRSSQEQRKAEIAASRTSGSGGVGETGSKLTIEQMNSMPLKDLEAVLPKAPGN